MNRTGFLRIQVIPAKQVEYHRPSSPILPRPCLTPYFLRSPQLLLGSKTFLIPLPTLFPARPKLLPISLPAARGLPFFISWPTCLPPSPTSCPALLKFPPVDSVP